jgi:hypothetical protein
MNLPEAQAKHIVQLEDSEERYVQLSGSVCQTMQKVMTIRNALASFELKVQKATIELEEELEIIRSNFNSVKTNT